MWPLDLPSAVWSLPSDKCGQVLFNPSAEDLIICEILKDAGGDGATKRLAQRKLDSVCFVNAYCCYANSEERIKLFKQAAQLAASLGDISKLSQEADATKKKAEADSFKDLAPGALAKVRLKNMDFNKLTIKEMQALAYEYYHVTNVTIPSTGLKKLKVDKLEEIYKENQDRLDKVSL